MSTIRETVGERFVECLNPRCRTHGLRRTQRAGEKCGSTDGTDECGQRLYIGCECICHHVRGFGRGDTIDSARLIAAAPDLLAACEALVTLWDSPEPFTGADALQAIGEATERARAAIAKAREGATD